MTRVLTDLELTTVKEEEMSDRKLERKLGSWEIQALKAKARELDIDNGGYCDVRTGAVNFWSGPGNCPEGQENLVYLKGAIGHPRNFIGTVYFEDLTIDTMNYERARQETGKAHLYGKDREPYVNAPEDVEWVKEQWATLWQAALPGAPVPEPTTTRVQR